MIMKTTMKNLAAGTFIAFLLMVGNVKAEGKETKTTTQAVETTLQLEKWMTDEAIWNKESTANQSIIQETETSLQFENWMTDEAIWRHIKHVEETETSLSIENWMTSKTIWEK
jgi:hypothetical protein